MVTAGLSAPQQQALERVIPLPLVSAGEFAAICGVTLSLARKRLPELRALGVLEAHDLGCSAQRPQRFHLSLDAQRDLGLERASWHQPGSLLTLLDRLPALEAIYRMAAEIRDLGEFVDFQWLGDGAVAGGALDAAVRYQRGWAALMYLGALRSEVNVETAVQSLSGPIAELGIGDPNPRPGLVAVAVTDAWTAELVTRVVERHGLDHWFRIYSLPRRDWIAKPPPTASRGWIFQPVYRRRATMSAWQDRLNGSPWAAEGMRDPANLLELARPGLRGLLGEQECNSLYRELHGQLTRESLEQRFTCEWQAKQRRARDEDAGPGTGDERAPTLNREKMASEGAEVIRERGAKLPGANAAVLEARSVLDRLAADLENPVSVAVIAAILGKVVEWPGITTPMLRLCLGEKTSGRTQRACAHLTDIGLLESWTDETHSDRSVRRFRPSDGCLNLMARGNRASKGEIQTRFRVSNWRNPDKVERHEYGLRELVEQFMGAGCPVVNGVREYENMGEAGALAPDALVYLDGGFLGDGWYRIEYELSATGPTRIERKLNGYASPLRRDSWPLLAVCRDELAERNFRAKGRELGLTRMLTTTVARLRRHGAVGNDRCWTLYGQPVALLGGPATGQDR